MLTWNNQLLFILRSVRYDVMLEGCSIPRLWGLSFLGTKMRVYCGNKASRDIHPEANPRPDPSSVFPSDFLAGGWSIDISSQEGFEKMKEVVVDIFTHTPNDK